MSSPGTASAGDAVPRAILRPARSVSRRLWWCAAIGVGLVVLALGARAEEPAAALSLTRLTAREPAAPFTVVTPEGRPLALADFRGRVVLLNFWATWCEPCLEEMPAMDRVARAYGERGLAGRASRCSPFRGRETGIAGPGTLSSKPS